MRTLLTRLGLLSLLISLSSCIENDIPYPVVELEITRLEGEGFQPRLFDRENRTIYLTLEEQTDLRKVLFSEYALNHEEATSSVDLRGSFDLRAPLYVTLSLYQDYLWTILAEQEIARSFTVEGQIGATEWDLKNHIARVYVPEGDADLSNITVTSLKLGPEGITEMTPSIEELTSFESVRYVDIRYHGDIEERWYLYVEPTELKVELTAADAWSRVIWLYGAGKSGAEMGFRYRKVGDEAWSEVPEVQVDGGTFTACLRVEELTSYEVLAYCGEDLSPVKSVTTQGIEQLPNCGLEEWSERDDIVYPYAADDEPFWGSGNVGASVANATLTQKSEDARPGSEGLWSARLESLFANVMGLGKFAAGNLYTGTYVRNVGTDGIITFGRPFTLRPTALRLWLKYNCGEVDKIKRLPAGSTLESGDPDTGSIYVALGTWTKEKYGYSPDKGTPVLYGDDSSPICIDTRHESTFFDPHGEDVVGYGELLMDYSVEGWQQITIPIHYTATDIVPTHIVVVCSASRLGDYFTGSTKSLLYVDDLELIYE